MADLANLVVTDDASASVTFVPGNREDTLVVWHDNNAVLAQRRTISISRRLATPSNGNHKYSVRVKIPTDALDPDTGKPVGHLQSITDIIMPEVSVVANREDLVSFAISSLTELKATIEDGDFLF